MKRAGHGLGSSFSDAFGATFTKIGVALGGVFAVSKAVSFFQDSIGGARDLAETQSATNVVFAEGAAAVNAFAANAVQKLGQTRQQALDASNTFATFGKSAGLSGQGLVDFSTRLVTLSADLASFKNTTPEEAITAIGAALRGESEPIRRYGILLDDATLRQRALTLGIVDNISTALTPQQKVLAAQAEIMAQTSDAQGDFARTSGGLANQQRITAAAIAETKTKIGNLLLPAVTAVTVFFNTKLLPVVEQKLIPALSKAKDWFGDKVVPAIKDKLIPAVRTLHEWFATRVVPNFQNYVLPALRILGAIIVDKVVPAVVTVTRAIASFVGWLTGTSKPAEFLRFVIVGVAAALLAYNVALGIVRAATIVWTAMQWLLNTALTANPIGLIIVAIGALVAAIIWVATKTQFFQTLWHNVWQGFKDIGAWFAGPFAGFFVDAWNKLVNGAVTVKDKVVGAFNNVVDFVTGLPGRIATAARGMWDGLVSSLRGALRAVQDWWNRIDVMVKIPNIIGLPHRGETFDLVPDIHIPGLQRGGLVDRTGLAIVHRGEVTGAAEEIAAALAGLGAAPQSDRAWQALLAAVQETNRLLAGLRLVVAPDGLALMVRAGEKQLAYAGGPR